MWTIPTGRVPKGYTQSMLSVEFLNETFDVGNDSPRFQDAILEIDRALAPRLGPSRQEPGRSAGTDLRGH